MTVIDTAVMWCATGGECDGTETCHTLCHPREQVPAVGEFVD